MNIFKHTKDKKPINKDLRLGKNPRMDWRAMLIVVFVGSLCMMVWGYVRYRNAVNTISSFDNIVSNKNNIGFDIKAVDMVIEKYNEKERLRLEAMKLYRGPTDPSL